MRIKIFILLLAVFATLTSAQVRTGGYFSFEFLKGQADADFPDGTFKDPQLGLFFSGEITPKVSFLTEARLNQAESVDLMQAWVSLVPSQYFNLKLGLYLVPFGGYNESSRPYQTMTINPPLNIAALYPAQWRDLGLVTEGRASGLLYSVYFGNGMRESPDLNQGQQFRDNNAGKGFGGKLGMSLSEGVVGYYSYYRGKSDNANKRSIILQGVNLAWETEDYQILGEYTKAKVENPEGFADGSGDGFFIQVSINFGGFNPFASYQRLTYRDDFHGIGFSGLSQPGSGILQKNRRWAIGVTARVYEMVLFKLEYDFNQEKDFEIDNNQLVCQLALSF